MDVILYTAARANLAQTMKRVCADHDPLIITRNGEPSVVSRLSTSMGKPPIERYANASMP